MADFTVVGYYDSEDRKHVIGVIEGQYLVRGGYEPYEGGLFADHVVADTWQEAEREIHGRRD
jgi:hypothetical protein